MNIPMEQFFVQHLDEYPWETNDQRPGRRWKLLVDSNRTPSNGLSLGVLEFAPGAELPAHAHTPREAYFILEGEGMLLLGDKTKKVRPGTVVYLPPDHVHGIRNIGAETHSLMWVFPTDSWGEVEYLFQ